MARAICLVVFVGLCGCPSDSGAPGNNNGNDNGNTNTNTNSNNNNDPPDPVCGNGIVDSGEVCDDGNTDDGDDCRGDCLQDMTLCGNGNLDPGEVCDHGDDNGWADASCTPNCATVEGELVGDVRPYALLNHTDSGPLLVYRGAAGPEARIYDWQPSPVTPPVALFAGFPDRWMQSPNRAVYRTDGSGRLVVWWGEPEGPQSTVYFFGSDLSLLAGPLTVEPTGDPTAVQGMGDLALNTAGDGVLGIRYTLSDGREVVYVCAVSASLGTVDSCYLAGEVQVPWPVRGVIGVGISESGVGFLARNYDDGAGEVVGIDPLTGAQLPAAAQHEVPSVAACGAALHLVNDTDGLLLRSRISDVACDASTVFRFGTAGPPTHIPNSQGGGSARLLSNPDASAIYAVGHRDLDQGSYLGRTGLHVPLVPLGAGAGPLMGSGRMNNPTFGVLRDDDSVLLMTYDSGLFAKWVGSDGYYLP